MTDIAGAVNTMTETVTVDSVPLNPVIGGGPSIPVGVTYLLNLSANPAADPVTTWSINWGDGNTITYPGNSTVVSHVYTSPSPDVVIHGQATNVDGPVATNDLDVDVTYVPPTLVISGPSTIPDVTPYALGLTATAPNSFTI